MSYQSFCAVCYDYSQDAYDDKEWCLKNICQTGCRETCNSCCDYDGDHKDQECDTCEQTGITLWCGNTCRDCCKDCKDFGLCGDDCGNHCEGDEDELGICGCCYHERADGVNGAPCNNFREGGELCTHCNKKTRWKCIACEEKDNTLYCFSCCTCYDEAEPQTKKQKNIE